MDQVRDTLLKEQGENTILFPDPNAQVFVGEPSEGCEGQQRQGQGTGRVAGRPAGCRKQGTGSAMLPLVPLDPRSNRESLKAQVRGREQDTVCRVG